MFSFKTKFKEQNPRSLAKVLTWRIIMMAQWFFVTLYTTGSVNTAAGVLGFTTIFNSLVYFLHERTWNIIDWGKKAGELEDQSSAG
jgi:uncharacterized membrane protein